MPSISILWGEHREIDDAPKTYEFDTPAERDAFVLGIQEMDGWSRWEEIGSNEAIWVIHQAGTDNSGESLLWQNGQGWTDDDEFDRFTTAEKETFSLPIGGAWSLAAYWGY